MDNPFVLAPMAGITDMPFRRLMKRMGAGCVISEFVSAHAVVNAPKRSGKYLSYHEEERPVGIQIFGDEDEILAEAAKIVEGTGVDFVDINLGCPVPKVTKGGGGSAWLCRPVELGKMLQKIRGAVKVPVTIKIRTGWDAQSINASEIVRIAKNEGIEWVAIHGRTRTQGYSGLADWELIESVAREKILPIIGNGDVVSGPLAAARMLKSGCDGIMIGRGALKNPWIFMEAVEALEAAKKLSIESQQSLSDHVIALQNPSEQTKLPDGVYYYQKSVKKLQPQPVSTTADWVRIRADRDAQALIDLHLSLMRESASEERVKFGFRKFLAWYSAGYPGSSAFRKFIFTHEDFPALIERALEFFDGVKRLGGESDLQRDAVPVLMGGHG
jgi:tRNA-dihydrouridine synthase B